MAFEALAEEVIADVNQRRAKIDDTDTRSSSNMALVANGA
jgi:hypothetical protein